MSFHSVCLDVCRSFYDLQPTTIDRSQPNLYLSSDPCKPFWIPYLPYFGCQREKYAKFRLFNAFSCHCKRDASCHLTCYCCFCFGRRVCRLSVCLSRVRSRKLSEIGAKKFRHFCRKSGSSSKNMRSDFSLEVVKYTKSSPKLQNSPQ